MRNMLLSAALSALFATGCWVENPAHRLSETAYRTLDPLEGAAGNRMRTKGAYGIGLMAGEPTGLSAKYYLNNKGNALAAGLGAGFIDGTSLHLHVDYLWEFDPPLVQEEAFDMRFYRGPGVRLRIRDGKDNDDKDDVDMGPRGVFGLSFQFKNSPFEIFVEGALGVDLIHPKFTIGGAIGGRYYF